MNHYDPCVANKMIGRKQMAVCWHVDDLKVSHEDPAEVTKFGKWLSTTYGVAIVTHRGKFSQLSWDYPRLLMQGQSHGKHDRIYQLYPL